MAIVSKDQWVFVCIISFVVVVVVVCLFVSMPGLWKELMVRCSWVHLSEKRYSNNASTSSYLTGETMK